MSLQWVPHSWREGKTPERKHRRGLTGRELLEGTKRNKRNFILLSVQEESHGHLSLPTLATGHQLGVTGLHQLAGRSYPDVIYCLWGVFQPACTGKPLSLQLRTPYRRSP